ncbi:MAG: pyruvoyl-dependent arginine decarboxylase [Micropruina sp.]|uniref:pyruvoyl-dependent arginine decarboxylase n=1 Tax=Micropruina sp. TaxID=2737536 RepID=UPI0039E5419B
MTKQGLGMNIAEDALVIRVTAGSGTGRTTMAAFDAALRSAGVADHNLIRLSSIIPGRAEVQICSAEEQLHGEFGDALYCVYAVAFATERGDAAWSGVGWSRAADGSGRGLFVEHAGHAEEQVRTMITSSLTDMSNGRDNAFVFENMVLSSALCSVRPACSVVVATYRTAGWGHA